MQLLEVFAHNVRRVRMEKGLSQEALAFECGLHRTYISALECGRRSISMDNIQKISEALGVEAYKLLIPEK